MSREVESTTVITTEQLRFVDASISAPNPPIPIFTFGFTFNSAHFSRFFCRVFFFDFPLQKALTETVAMEKALVEAMEITSENETLFIVTADHSHTFALAGYPRRTANIFNVLEVNLIFLPRKATLAIGRFWLVGLVGR